jgi:hypothetical protein
MRRHDFDALSFVFGLASACVGLVLLGGGAPRGGLALPWTGPAVAIGVAILIVIAVRPRAESTAAADGALEDGPPA